MSQHQPTIFADAKAEVSGDLTRVARQVLSMLATSKECERSGLDHEAPFGPGAGPLNPYPIAQRLYEMSFCPERDRFDAAFADAQSAGCSNGQLAFELIPVIARQLGAAWESDLISFADVTIGCARLQSALRLLPDDLDLNPEPYGGIQRSCLVMKVPGAQHTLGALVLAKQLRQARQSVHVELEAHYDTRSVPLFDQNFDLILITASRSESPAAVRDLVSMSRQTWAKSRIVVGGSICELDQAIMTIVKPDLMTKDWQEALDICI